MTLYQFMFSSFWVFIGTIPILIIALIAWVALIKGVVAIVAVIAHGGKTDINIT